MAKRSRNRTCTWSLALGLALVFAGPAASNAAGAPRIVNGLTTHDFPTTGALLVGFGALPIDPNNATIECSGTLIGCRTFLTAAHCVASDGDPTHYAVYLQHAGLFTVSSVTANPDYVGNLSGHDVAIVKLASDVTGIAPTPINSTHDLAAIGAGLAGTIAGFGQTAFNGRDYGIKRFGAVQTAACNTSVTGGEGDDKLVCWDFAIPVGPPGQDSDTCNGDSGGPLFIDFGGGAEVVGVTSSGSSPFCRPLDHSFDASVYFNAAWIEGQLGGDSTASCGGIGPVDSPAAAIAGVDGALSGAHLSDSLSFDVPASTSLLRFALNGQDNHTFNADFYVKQGGGASASNFDCKADGASMYGACEFAAPAPGLWSVFVADALGAGAYQVTMTTFAEPAPVCGNGVREGSEQCDGADLGVCSAGPCQSDCTCPVGCGDGIVQAGEACDDGAANGSASSCCSAQCTLKPAGTDCADDGNVCTLDVCDGSTSVCRHPAGHAGTVCRAATGPCDLPEACDGVSSGCPPDAVVPDSDGDGLCDAIDPCTNPGGGQNFLAAAHPKLSLTKINTDPNPGNDGLMLKSAFPLAAGESFAGLDPLAQGARLLLTDATSKSTIADVALPPGAFAGNHSRGWKLNQARTAWQFRDATGSPANGIVTVWIRDESKKLPRRVAVAIAGKNGHYAVAPGDEPLRAIVVLGDQAAAAAGLCGESAFVGGDCAFNRPKNGLICMQ